MEPGDTSAFRRQADEQPAEQSEERTRCPED